MGRKATRVNENIITIRLPSGVVPAIERELEAERAKHPGRFVSRNGLIAEALTAAFGSNILQPVANS